MIHLKLTVILSIQSDNGLRQCGLATAAFTYNAENLTLIKIKTHIMDNMLAFILT